MFGKTSDGKPVFGLPGNPVSTQICLYRYVLPYLGKAIGLAPRAAHYVALSEPVQVKTAVTYFLPVTVRSVLNGRWDAAPIFPQNSGDLVSLTKSDGFIELPSEVFDLRKGSVQRFYAWDSIS